jgi:hypothetical protein
MRGKRNQVNGFNGRRWYLRSSGREIRGRMRDTDVICVGIKSQRMLRGDPLASCVEMETTPMRRGGKSLAVASKRSHRK